MGRWLLKELIRFFGQSKEVGLVGLELASAAKLKLDKYPPYHPPSCITFGGNSNIKVSSVKGMVTPLKSVTELRVTNTAISRATAKSNIKHEPLMEITRTSLMGVK